jgi:hypothetical protein
VKRRDVISGHPPTTSTPTGIQNTADIARLYPSLYWQIREEAVADERRRVKTLDTTPPQDEKSEGETLMEKAAERAAARRK